MAVSTVNPWAAGAVVLNQQPFMAFYERQMAKEQAKNDALENYFKDLNKNITSAGMRSQDVPSLLQKNKQWQDHYIQNKDAILHPQKDNGAAYSKYMSGYQDQLAVTNESKGAQKNAEELGKLKFNKDFSYVFDDPEITKSIESDALPIGDPNRKALDINSIAKPPKPIDMKDREAFSKYAVGELKPDEIRGTPINIGNFQTQTPVTNQYSDQNKKTIGQRAADVYDTDRNWRAEAGKMFKEQVLHDPVLHDQLNAIHKRYFGTDVDSPREAFIAKTILDHDVRNVKYEKGENEYGKQLALENLRFGHQKTLKKEDQKVADDWIVNYWNQRFNDAKTTPAKGITSDDPNNYLASRFKVIHQLNPDQIMMEALKKSGVYPDDVYVTQDNKLLPVFYKYKNVVNAKGTVVGTEVEKDKKGKKIIDEDMTNPLGIDQAYLSMGYKGQTKKGLGSTMQNAYEGGKKESQPTARKYSIEGKTYTHEQLSKMYSEDKIKQYLDAGIIK